MRFIPLALATALALSLGCASAEKKPEAAATAEVTKASKDEVKKEAKKLVVDTLPEEVGLPRTGPLYFETDSDVLTEKSQKQLAAIAEYMAKEKKARISIEGHADARGSTDYNLALGDRRAKTAREYLVRLGVEDARIGHVSFGEEKPADDAETEAGYTQNRRDEFRFVLDGGA